MNDAFKEEIDSGDYGIYMDDILVATDGTFEHHVECIHHILDKIKENDLFLKPEKCTFHKKEINYLGLIIGNGAVRMDPIKVEGITKWPIPMTVKQGRMLRSRLGARWSDVDVMKSLKAGTGNGELCREQRSYCTTGTTLGQVHT